MYDQPLRLCIAVIQNMHLPVQPLAMNLNKDVDEEETLSPSPFARLRWTKNMQECKSRPPYKP